MLFIGYQDGWAQAETQWMNVGDFQHQYSSVGSEPSCCIKKDGQFWPGIFKSRRHGVMVRNSIFIGTKDFTDAEGNHFPVKVAHTGPRVYKIGTEFFPEPMELIGRFPLPEVWVDGLQSFDKPVTLTKVDPNQQAAGKLVRQANTVVGVTMKNTVWAFSQQHHDDYHIHEYVFTNTGNTDGDDAIERPDQTLKDVYFYFTDKYKFWQGNSIIRAGGTNTMVDYFGDGNEMDGYPIGKPYRAFLSWQGITPWDKANSLGTPVWTDNWGSAVVEGDSIGRLATAHMVSRAVLHADSSPEDPTDDPAQPSHTGFVRGGDPITNTLDHRNVEQMKDEYAYMSKDGTYRDYGRPGHEFPHHADIVANRQMGQSWIEAMANQSDMPSRGHGGGWVPNFSFGPYQLDPGESIRLVWIEGFAGLDRQAAVAIGKAYKRSGGDDELLIPYDADSDGQIEEDEQLTKNYWVLTSKDSVFKMIEKAKQNWASGFAIPKAPKPPKSFRVTSGADKITLEWETYPDADPASFEIWRSRNRYQGAVEEEWQYEKIAELSADVQRYEDTEVTRGISYYYYIQSVGQVNNDATAMTPTGAPLKSSRYYTQTYDPAFLKRPPGKRLSDIRIVPNPYHLGADKNLRWPDQQDKLAFLEIPGECTIRIYTELGELVETIEHTDGSGDETWNLTTSANQVVVSGIYAAVIEDHQTGEQIIKKFVVIR